MSPNIRLSCVSDNDEKFEARGAFRGEGAEIADLVATVIEGVPLPIRGLGDGPIPTYNASILGLPSPPELLTNASETGLTAQATDQDGNLVYPSYDPANWAWAIDNDTTGGASFGGPDGDDLTVGPNPGTVTISATTTVASEVHGDIEVVASVVISVVATIVFSPILRGLPAETIEEQSYQLSAEVLNADGSVQAGYNPAEWTPSITAGGAFASLGGANNDVLTINAASAGNSVTVRFDYTGGLNVSPAFIAESTSIVAPASPFPEVLEQPGMTVALANEGDTTAFGSGWSAQADWNDPSRLAVVTDGSSKFGSVLEKMSFPGDSGWLGAYNRGIGVVDHRTLYVRYVFQLSTNWQRAPAELAFRYGRGIPGISLTTHFNLYIRNSSPGIRWTNGLSGADVPNASRNGIFEPNTPQFSALARGTYHTLELLHRLNTNGNADGFLRVAVNGVKVQTWDIAGKESNVDVRSGTEWLTTNDNWDALRFTELNVFHQWSSSTNKSVNDSVRMSELYIAGSNP